MQVVFQLHRPLIKRTLMVLLLKQSMLIQQKRQQLEVLIQERLVNVSAKLTICISFVIKLMALQITNVDLPFIMAVANL